MAFNKQYAASWAKDWRSGEVAVNVCGMPVAVVTAILQAAKDEFGLDLIRHASASDDLGPGSWYVLLPSKEGDR